MRELYEAANNPSSTTDRKPTWLRVQKLAVSNSGKDQQQLEDLVQKTARATVRLPIIRKAINDRTFPSQDGEWSVAEGQTVFLDIVRELLYLGRSNH